YDPDESPEGLATKLLADQEHLGRSAVEEVAAEARHGVDKALEPMREVSRSRKPKEGGYRISIPHLDCPALDNESLPWENAAELAALARKEWNLGTKPIRDKKLAELLSTGTQIFSSESSPRSRTPFAIRKG